MNRLALLILVFSVFLGLSMAYLPGDSVRTQEMVFDTNGTVINQTGNDTKQLGIVSNPQLRFGSIPVGSASMKFLKLNAPRKSMVKLESEGNISERLEHTELLYFEGEKRISVRFNGSEPGFYNGEIRVKTWNPNDNLGKRWIDLKYQLYRYFY